MQGARGSSNVLRSPLRTLKGFLIRILRVKDSSATGSHLEMRWLYLIKSKIPSCFYKIAFPLPPFPLVEFLFAYVMFRLLTFFLQPQKTFSCSACNQIRWGGGGGTTLCTSSGVPVKLWTPSGTSADIYLAGEVATKVFGSSCLLSSNVYRMWQANAEPLLHLLKASSLQWPKTFIKKQSEKPVF